MYIYIYDIWVCLKMRYPCRIAVSMEKNCNPPWFFLGDTTNRKWWHGLNQWLTCQIHCIQNSWRTCIQWQLFSHCDKLGMSLWFFTTAVAKPWKLLLIAPFYLIWSCLGPPKSTCSIIKMIQNAKQLLIKKQMFGSSTCPLAGSTSHFWSRGLHVLELAGHLPLGRSQMKSQKNG